MVEDLSSFVPLGNSTTGGTYYAKEFGIGGDQTTFDSETNTFSSNKDALAKQLFEEKRLFPNWMILFNAQSAEVPSSASEKAEIVAKDLNKTDWFWIIFYGIIILAIFIVIERSL